MSRDILLSAIDTDPNQPRRYFDKAKLADLAQSMGASGLAVPILLRQNGGGRFIIVHGERRYRAAKTLGWETIRAEVSDVSEGEARWLSLVENVQRADLSPIEEAKAYQVRLSDGTTQTELGERIGKSQSYIAQKLRLLRLPDGIQSAIDANDITEGHARQLLRLKDTGQQDDLCQRAITEGWAVARVRLEVDETERRAEWDRQGAILEDVTKALAEICDEIPNCNDLPTLVAIIKACDEISGELKERQIRLERAVTLWLSENGETMSRDIVVEEGLGL